MAKYDRPRYLDGGISRARYEHNAVYKNAGGPLLFTSHQNKNAWFDNLFLKDGTLPPEFIEVLQTRVGLESAYRKSILGQEPNPCRFSVLSDPATATGWSVYQFHLPAKTAVSCRSTDGRTALRKRLR